MLPHPTATHVSPVSRGDELSGTQAELVVFVNSCSANVSIKTKPGFLSVKINQTSASYFEFKNTNFKLTKLLEAGDETTHVPFTCGG